VEGREREEMGVYLRFGEKYTHGISRARGTTKLNLFFFINNRVIGLIVNITLNLDNSYDNIL
jgi:hypothetical protein